MEFFLEFIQIKEEILKVRLLNFVDFMGLRRYELYCIIFKEMYSVKDLIE